MKKHLKIQHYQYHQHQRRQMGFSLLEVLLAWGILSGVLLSVIDMQISSLRQARHAYLQTLAAEQQQSMLERLRANASAVARQRDFMIWNTENANLLPMGRGDYKCSDDAKICVIKLDWQEQGGQYNQVLTAVI